MRVSPGQPIPLWLRLWDGRSDRFVVAHVTDEEGTEVSGSPYLLTYSSQGIYVGAGTTIGIFNLYVYYQVYLDSGLTNPDRGYVPPSEVMESDISNSEVLSTLLSKISSISPETLTAIVESHEIIAGLDLDEITTGGMIQIENTSMATIESSDIIGTEDEMIIEGENN